MKKDWYKGAKREMKEERSFPGWKMRCIRHDLLFPLKYHYQKWKLLGGMLDGRVWRTREERHFRQSDEVAFSLCCECENKETVRVEVATISSVKIKNFKGNEFISYFSTISFFFFSFYSFV